MNKKIKIMCILSIISIVIFFYLLFSSKKVFYNSQNNNQEEKVLDEFPEKENYQFNMATISKEYIKLEKNNEIVIEKVLEIKKQALDLKVTEEFKDLHLDIILALDKMIKFLEEGNIAKKSEKQEINNEIKAHFNLLNRL